MSEGDGHEEGFEAGLRRLAEQVSRSVERLGELDTDDIAQAMGVDPDRAREFVESAGQWLNEQAESFAREAALWVGGLRGEAPDRDNLRGAGPHPLDLPTAAQGLALSALDSGRWTVEPGSHVLMSDGEGPGPTDAVGLVGELRARDWIDAQGKVTLVGQDALKRWLAHADSA
jgi:hypothetical protein